MFVLMFIATHRRGNASTSGISSTGTFARYFSRESLSCKASNIFSVRSNPSKLSIQPCKRLEQCDLLSSNKSISVTVWLDSDMAFKFEPSNTQLSSAFTPIDVTLFERRSFVVDLCSSSVLAR